MEIFTPLNHFECTVSIRIKHLKFDTLQSNIHYQSSNPMFAHVSLTTTVALCQAPFELRQHTGKRLNTRTAPLDLIVTRIVMTNCWRSSSPGPAAHPKTSWQTKGWLLWCPKCATTSACCASMCMWNEERETLVSARRSRLSWIIHSNWHTVRERNRFPLGFFRWVGIYARVDGRLSEWWRASS